MQHSYKGRALTCRKTKAATATACSDRQTIIAAVKRPSSLSGRIRMRTVLCSTAGALHLSCLVAVIQCPGQAAMPTNSCITSAMQL